MINKQFEAYKITREIKRSGQAFTFYRQYKNDFGEPSSAQPITVGIVSGLYHEQSERIEIKTGNTTQVRNKPLPMLLCLYSDIGRLTLQVGDYMIFNGVQLRVTGIINVQGWNTVGDMSLEVVDVGGGNNDKED